MTLVRPTRVRVLILVVLAMSTAMAVPGVALAHNGTGGANSDYRIEITGFDGDPSGIELRIVELGNRIELRRTTATEVIVLGYSGEPYLRLDSSGVFENVNSPAHYLNRDRFASMDPPDTASADATPEWTQTSEGATVRWHDHRAHWMSTTPRADVLADPDTERVIFEASPVELIVDGRTVTAFVKVTWLPTPERLVWLGVAALAGLVIAAAIVMLPRVAALQGFLALDAAIAVIIGQGPSTTRHLLCAAVIAIALVGLALRRRLIAVAAAAAAGMLAATSQEVYEHELLAGWVSGTGQRVAITVAIALSLGVVAAALVGALGPTDGSADTVAASGEGDERSVLQGVEVRS